MSSRLSLYVKLGIQYKSSHHALFCLVSRDCNSDQLCCKKSADTYTIVYKLHMNSNYIFPSAMHCLYIILNVQQLFIAS